MCCREVLLSRSGESQSCFTGYYSTWSPNWLRFTRTYANASAGICLNTKIYTFYMFTFSLFRANVWFKTHWAITLSSLFFSYLSVLTYIFMIDVNLPHTQPTTSPRIREFTERVLARLKPLTEGEEEIQNHIMEENTEGDQDERTQAIRLLKTGVFCIPFC